MNQLFCAGFNLQLLASLYRERARTAGAANEQTNPSSLSAASYTTHDRSHSCANTGPFNGLIRPAAGFDAAFVISATGITAVNLCHISMQGTLPTITEFD